MTVLFADIRGSTSVVEKLDPEEVRKYFDPILHIMMDAVHRYEGTVNQVLGDGIMALFGAPLTHEDHALRACYAALAMQEAMQRYSETARERRRAENRHRHQLRRSRGSLDHQRSQHRLRRSRPDDSFGRAHGSAGGRRRRSC